MSHFAAASFIILSIAVKKFKQTGGGGGRKFSTGDFRKCIFCLCQGGAGGRGIPCSYTTELSQKGLAVATMPSPQPCITLNFRLTNILYIFYETTGTIHCRKWIMVYPSSDGSSSSRVQNRGRGTGGGNWRHVPQHSWGQKYFSTLTFPWTLCSRPWCPPFFVVFLRLWFKTDLTNSHNILYI